MRSPRFLVGFRGIGTIEQTLGSPRSQAINVRSNISTSITSVFARRARLSTGRLDGWITWTSMPRRPRKRASQNPSRPASCVSITRAIVLPAVAHLAFNRSMKAANSSPPAFKTCREWRLTPRQLNGEHPFLLAQFQRADNSRIVVEGRPAWIPRIETSSFSLRSFDRPRIPDLGRRSPSSDLHQTGRPPTIAVASGTAS